MREIVGIVHKCRGDGCACRLPYGKVIFSAPLPSFSGVFTGSMMFSPDRTLIERLFRVLQYKADAAGI